jgi:hypothetical protein
VVAALGVLGAVVFMGLCGVVAVIAWLRPGAATPITVMATVMGAMGTLVTPFMRAVDGERQPAAAVARSTPASRPRADLAQRLADAVRARRTCAP